MGYDTKRHDICIEDKAEAYTIEIQKELQRQRGIKVMSYDSSRVGTEFIEDRQTIRTGGSFSTINPLEHDLATIIVDTELQKGIVVMHDPDYRDIIRHTVGELNKRFATDFPVIYERNIKSELYFNRS